MNKMKLNLYHSLEDNFKRLIYSKQNKAVFDYVEIKDTDFLSNKGIDQVKIKLNNSLTLMRLLKKMNNHNFSSSNYYKLVFNNISVLSNNLQKDQCKFDRSYFLFFLGITNIYSTSGNKVKTDPVIDCLSKLKNKDKTIILNYSLQLIKDKIFDAMNLENKLKILFYFSVLVKNKIYLSQSSDMDIKLFKTIYEKQIDKTLQYHLTLDSDINLHYVYLRIIHNMLDNDSSKSKIFFNYLDFLLTKIINTDKQIIPIFIEVMKIYLIVTTTERDVKMLIEKYLLFKKTLRDFYINSTNISNYDKDNNLFPNLLVLNAIDNKIERNIENNVKNNKAEIVYVKSHSLFQLALEHAFSQGIYNIKEQIYVLNYLMKTTNNIEEIIKNNMYNFLTIFIQNYSNFISCITKEILYKNKSESKQQLLSILESIIKFKNDHQYIEMLYSVRIIGVIEVNN